MNYKIYKTKFGLDKYKIYYSNGGVGYIRNETALALTEASLNGNGHTRIGEIEVQEPTIIMSEEDFEDDNDDSEDELEDCEEDEEENRNDMRSER